MARFLRVASDVENRDCTADKVVHDPETVLGKHGQHSRRHMQDVSVSLVWGWVEADLVDQRQNRPPVEIV